MSLNFLPLQRMFQAIVAPDSMISETRDLNVAFTSRNNRGISGPGPRNKNRNLSPTARPILLPAAPNDPSTSKFRISLPSSPVLRLSQAPVANGKNRRNTPSPARLATESRVPGASEPTLPMSDMDYAIALQIEEIETVHETFMDEEIARMLDAGIDITPRLASMRYNLRPRHTNASAEQCIHECTSCFDKFNHLVGLRSACGHFYCFTCVRNMVNASLEGSAAAFPPKCCSKPLIGTFADKADGDVHVKLLGQVLDDPELTEQMETKWKEISINPTDRVYCSKPGCSEFLGSAIELVNNLTKSEGPSRSSVPSPSSPSASSPSGTVHFLRRFTTPKPPASPRVPPLAVKCLKCQSLTCIPCRQPEHGDQSCLERLDVQFWDLVKDKQWKKCPHCAAVVEKNGGCSNVVCRCGRGFTY